jgi:diguanylate cyclase (GGDEF)-like protein
MPRLTSIPLAGIRILISALFGQKSRTPAAEPTTARPVVVVPSPAAAEATARREAEMVLDTLGSVLQAYARFAVPFGRHSVTDIQTLIGGWAQHVTVGLPRPGHEGEPPRGPVLDRDWKGLVHAFADVRRSEHDHVITSQDDLRAVVHAFVSAARAMAIEEDEAHRSTAEILERVTYATATQDTDVIKREALAAVAAINDLMERRREAQRARFAALAADVQHLGEELEVARSEAMTDALTGLANRKAFDDALPRQIEIHAMLAKPACLVFVDVDHFKQVNDTRGHPIGDELLRQVSRALARTFLRRCDLVVRLGGDEFAAILPETSARNAATLAERLRDDVRMLGMGETALLEDPPTLSVGIAELVLGDDVATFVKRADDALYASKRAGRDRVTIATSEAPLRLE